MEGDLLSSSGDIRKLRRWLREHDGVRALLKKHNMRRIRSVAGSSAEYAAALEAIDALPKVIARAKSLRSRGKRTTPSDGRRQGQQHIGQIVKVIDSLLACPAPAPAPAPASASASASEHREVATSSRRDDLRAYVNGASRRDDRRRLISLLDHRLAVLLAAYGNYNLADLTARLEPRGLSERLAWSLQSRRFGGRFRLTPDRSEELLRLRQALARIPPNIRAGRPQLPSRQVIRAGVICWKAFKQPMEFRFSSVKDELSGDVVTFLRGLLALAGVPPLSDTALNQQLRTLSSV